MSRSKSRNCRVRRLPPRPPPAGSAAAHGACDARQPARRRGRGNRQPRPTPAPAQRRRPRFVNNGDPWFICAQGNWARQHRGIGHQQLSRHLQPACGRRHCRLPAGGPFALYRALQPELDVLHQCLPDQHGLLTSTRSSPNSPRGCKQSTRFVQADLQANYQACITSGAINTVINENGAAVDRRHERIIDKQVSDMQTNAWNLVKSRDFRLAAQA